MAGTITLNASFTTIHGRERETFTASVDQLVQDVEGFVAETVTSTTTQADIALAGITTSGYMILKNTEETGIAPSGVITYGPRSGGTMIAMGILNPQEIAILRFAEASGNPIRHVTNVGTAALKVIVYED